ncbi:hypothetical protein UCDDA912_g00889 [Diaporthe ampelina]|uniref:Uncharacterized protein n=1 Tax=Diaporthe ampelina TaxID=1214573 RepID=A0A0G2FY75_9PEZI|nr:hypothetical protein UCDDA912_g00889 [Diaporthe ampelina]
MTPPKKQDLDRILRFCATWPGSAPSPPIRRGDVYCLSSFTRRAEQWYRAEAGRQLTQRSRDAAAVGKRRRQPSRAAKGTLEPGDYVLPEKEVDSLLHSAASPQETDKGGGTGSTPPGDQADKDTGDPQKGEQPPGVGTRGPEARLGDFRSRLGRAIHAKGRGLRARHDREGGVRHTCTVGGSGWDCVDGEYCGHGLVDRCVRWVPRGKAHLRARVRLEMEEFFSSGNGGNNNNNNNNNSPGRLAELKRARAAALRAETVRRLEGIEARLQSATSAAAEAEMLESPTMGRWPAEPQGFLREDADAQRVELAGLVFAVDVCLGELRVLML